VRPSPEPHAPGLICGCTERTTPGPSLSQWAQAFAKPDLPWGPVMKNLYFSGRATKAIRLWKECRQRLLLCGKRSAALSMRLSGLVKMILHTVAEWKLGRRIRRDLGAVVYQRRMIASEKDKPVDVGCLGVGHTWRLASAFIRARVAAAAFSTHQRAGVVSRVQAVVAARSASAGGFPVASVAAASASTFKFF
jgi:hypothetical protein